MRDNNVIKLLLSLPVILITLYFIPFLGVCLIILRLVMKPLKRTNFLKIFIALGFIILIPKGIDFVLDIIKFDKSTVPYLNEILTSNIYNVELIDYSKYLITLGVVFIILTYLFQKMYYKVTSKLNSNIRNYINETQKRDYEIAKKNDMEIKLKQEKMKNTTYVKCPNCGADNLVSDKFTVCKYCRTQIVNPNYKG